MPQLPNRNNLDFAPDSIISASKKLSVVQSSQMKDALDTDATLRPIKDANDTKREMGRFVDKIAEIGDLFNMIRTVTARLGYVTLGNYGQLLADREEGAGRRHLTRLYGGMDPSEEGLSSMANLGIFKQPRKPRKKVELIIADDSTEASPKPTKGKVRNITDFFEKLSKQSAGEGARIPSGASAEDRSESRGSVRSETRTEDFDELEDADGGDFDPSEPSSSSSSGSSSISSNESTFGDFDPDGRNKIYEKDPRARIVDGILRATKLMREADRIALALKDYKQYLDPSDINDLKDSYQVLIKTWTSFSAPFEGFDLFDFLSHEIDFVDDMLKILNDERKKLMMDILMLVNAYQATVLPNMDPRTLLQPVANVLDNYGAVNQVSEALGAGRNFYGKTINTSRDIPNIYGSRQSCPTKYLL
jgi:hypothetical protein